MSMIDPKVDLIERAHDAFDAAYREALPLFGDAEDHAEAVRSGVEAVLVLAGAITPEPRP